MPGAYSVSTEYFSAKSAYCAAVAVPVNVVVVKLPFALSNVRLVPDLGARSPVAAVTNRTLQLVSELSSATVTVVAIAAVPVMSELVSATVPAVAGKTISTSAVLAAPTRVTPLVPLSVPSSSLIFPPTLLLVALMTGALIVGAVIVLFVSVSVVALPTRVSALLGRLRSTSAVLAGATSVTPFVPLSVPSSSFSLPPTVVLVALITGALITGAVSVLFVSVSVVALPTSVSALAGSNTVTSPVLAGPCSVTPLVPLSVPSRNLILPAALLLAAPSTILWPVAVVVVAATVVILSVPSIFVTTCPVPLSVTSTRLLPSLILSELKLDTCASTYAFVAASCAEPGSVTLTILLLFISI